MPPCWYLLQRTCQLQALHSLAVSYYTKNKKITNTSPKDNAVYYYVLPLEEIKDIDQPRNYQHLLVGVVGGHDLPHCILWRNNRQ